MTNSLIQEAIEAAATQDLCGNHNSADLLRRLARELEAERKAADDLASAAGLALRSHGCILLSDPPQDPWKFHRVSDRLTFAIDAHAKRREAGE